MSVFSILGILFLAAGAYKKRALTLPGAFAAIGVALVIVLGTGMFGLLILAVFFLSSSILGKLFDKRFPDNEVEEKGNHRDHKQVLANGGWPALAAFIYTLTGNPIWLVAFLSGFAAATSDTWASEFGRLSKGVPVDILRFQRVTRGQSGAVTPVGTLGAILGSLTIILAAMLFIPFSPEVFSYELLVAVGVLGFTGQLIDTIAGGTVQPLYECPLCGRKTEKRRHCSTPTVCVRGISWLDNDAVNHLCTGSAVVLTWMLLTFI
ncbi:DUF92 domain-containing protein [Alteribacter populi]|uniref:DUF92 domain-containing protein n=1 Tax=Alteribacter populi TaxID=2011011 RepID=UPI000BBA42E0|nr:DUF92 domain-containing protein [Alteribacter populi]